MSSQIFAASKTDPASYFFAEPVTRVFSLKNRFTKNTCKEKLGSSEKCNPVVIGEHWYRFSGDNT